MSKTLVTHTSPYAHTCYRRGGQLNLHHVLPSTFFGEDEVMQGIEERVQTAVAAEDDTVLAAVPARVFQMLLQSEVSVWLHDIERE